MLKMIFIYRILTHCAQNDFDTLCSKWFWHTVLKKILTHCAQNDFLPHNVYVYFLCGLMCTWIHESVAELICMRFFSDVLTYCVMLQAFICYCSSSDVYDVRACALACVLFIGIVQSNWACLTWKSAIEIKLLLLLSGDPLKVTVLMSSF